MSSFRDGEGPFIATTPGGDDAPTRVVKEDGPAEPGTSDDLADFTLQRLLGQGSFGRVFLAWQRSMRRSVALKISADRGVEAQTLARLDHPYIVRVFDQRSRSGRRTRLLYMEPLLGGTLEQVIQHTRNLPPGQRSGRHYVEVVDANVKKVGRASNQRGSPCAQLSRLTWPELVCWVGMRLAQALDHAAQQGVVHRDIKPANVLLSSDGIPKISDFNISSLSVQDEAGGPRAGGSLLYMSPEQLDTLHPEQPLDPRHLTPASDVYSLGLVLWELLMGSRPFVEENPSSNLGQRAMDLARRRRAGLDSAMITRAEAVGSPMMIAILRQCLSADPAERPTGKDLARDLALALESPVAKLMDLSRGRWRQGVLASPITALLLIGVWPNALATVFHFLYYHREFIAQWPEAASTFGSIHLAIDFVLFAVGIGVFVRLAWPVSRAIRRVRRKESPGDLAAMQRRCLFLGQIGCRISLAGWLAGCLTYPVSLTAVLGFFDAEAFFHFVASLAVCGLFAGIYPFFCGTFIVLRVLYPALAGKEGDVSEFPLLARLIHRYLLLAAAIPLLAVGLLVLFRPESRFGLGLMAVAGLAGFALAFSLSRTLFADLRSLAYALQAPHELLQGNSRPLRAFV